MYTENDLNRVSDLVARLTEREQTAPPESRRDLEGLDGYNALDHNTAEDFKTATAKVKNREHHVLDCNMRCCPCAQNDDSVGRKMDEKECTAASSLSIDEVRCMSIHTTFCVDCCFLDQTLRDNFDIFSKRLFLTHILTGCVLFL